VAFSPSTFSRKHSRTVSQPQNKIEWKFPKSPQTTRVARANRRRSHKSATNPMELQQTNLCDSERSEESLPLSAATCPEKPIRTRYRNPKFEISNLKFHISNFKSKIVNLKS
jgi:hypothetical protein